jgi:hypothetical protein
MMDFIREHQLNFMLVLAGVCFAVTLCGVVSRTAKFRKLALIVMCLSATMLMVADRYAYIYRGDETVTGYYMVRISNFVTFLCPLLIAHSYNWYISDFIKSKVADLKTPLRLRINEILAFCGIVLLVISQFTGLYYTFDEHNRYQRSSGYLFSVVIPLAMWIVIVSAVLKYRKNFNRLMVTTLVVFSLVPIVAAFVQFFCYGISVTNLTLATLVVVLRLVEIIDTGKELANANKREREIQKHLFEETALALANAIDAKDAYTHGHSTRVAEYSRKIAELAGKSEQECEEIYYAGLLHDVGKIGVPEAIITKEGRLTDEEFEMIKKHPAFGADILKDISEYPYLSIGARHHHERYDGKGYPDKLVGTDIPDIARIIAVADSYDAMTSKRSYRKTIPQQKVREEFVSCAGTQFDPQYANIMLHLIDSDTQYKMKEKELNSPSIKDELVVGSHKDDVSIGITVIPYMVTLDMNVRSDGSAFDPKPSVLLFDSLDGRYHDDAKEVQDLLYYEYCELGFDGEAVKANARKVETKVFDTKDDIPSEGHYRVEAVRVEDHVLIRIIGCEKTCEYIVALPDSARYSYIGFTGEHCIISDMSMNRSSDAKEEGFIPRIAEKVSYIDVPEGDIPNVQSDRYRSASSKGIPVRDGMTIRFHSMSLPTARLVWHCPFCVIYSSDDGSVTGNNFVEYAVIRLDGETWEDGESADNDLIVSRTGFEGWDVWKKQNKEGMDVTLNFERNGNTVVTRTNNLNIYIKNTTTIKDGNSEIYAALTGDQCAITDIRITNV